jgi:hypothetical protein
VATLGVNYNLGVPACKNIKYTLQARSLNGTGLASTSVSVANTEVGSYSITVAVPGAPSAICAALITSGGGGKQFDFVPTTSDSQCVGGGTYFELDGGTGGGFMR